MVLRQSYHQSMSPLWSEQSVWHWIAIYAFMQCRTCQSPSREQLQPTVDDTKAGRKWSYNFIAGRSRMLWVHPLLRVRCGVVRSLGRNSSRFYLETRWHCIAIVADCHKRNDSTAPACPDWPFSISLRFFRIIWWKLNAVGLGLEVVFLSS